MYVQEVCNWYTMIYSIQVPHRNKCTGASLVLVCIENTLYCVPLDIAICVQVNTCTSSVQLVHNELQHPGPPSQQVYFKCTSAPLVSSCVQLVHNELQRAVSPLI